MFVIRFSFNNRKHPLRVVACVAILYHILIYIYAPRTGSMNDSHHDNAYYDTKSQSRKRRRMQRQPPQSVERARILSALRLPTTIILIFSSLITQSVFIEVSGHVLLPVVPTRIQTYQTANKLLINSNVQNTFSSVKLQQRHRKETSTALYFDGDTSTSPGQQPIPSVYDNEGTIVREQKRREQPSPSATAHYYPSSSQQNKISSRKMQLRWIAQTVQKLIYRKNSRSSNSLVDANSSNSSLDAESSSNIIRSNITAARSSQLLLEGLELLCLARTQAQVTEAGRMIESANVIQTQSIAIQERVVKATAMTGLLHIAVRVIEHMVHNEQYLPSPICQDAISNGLRRAGRIQQLNQLLLQLGSIARPQNRSISLIAFNSYLAALCDIVTGKDDAVQQQRYPADKTSLAGYDVADLDYKLMALDRAWFCLSDLDRTKQTMAIVPDSVSYATVMQAAASIGNQTIVDAVWEKIRSGNVHPNIVAYNARLRSTTVMNNIGSTIGNALSKSGTRLGRQKKRDQEILNVWDKEISSNPYVISDKYTIDLLLLPLIRAGRVGDVESLLDNFIKRNSESSVSNAFTAFLLTLVAGGELSTARALFEMYILPTLSPVVFSDAGGMIRMVRPTTRHFNVLIEGYRKCYQSDRFVSNSSNNETVTIMLDATVQAWSLYDVMTRSLNVRPDSYTTTSMMGLCRTSTELSNLLFQSVIKFDIECSSVVLRAACTYPYDWSQVLSNIDIILNISVPHFSVTAFGDLGDASSIIWLFTAYAPTTTRTWNVVLGALAKVAENGNPYEINANTSTAAIAFQNYVSQTSTARIHTFLQQTNIFDVVQMLLQGMCQQEKIDGISAPNADSQTLCVAAAALQYGPSAGAEIANSLFHIATKLNIPADGRFVNAAMRCFGNDIDAALIAWRDNIRPKCIALEKRVLSSSASASSGKKNLVAAYNGLLHVCGRALRPDIALRVVYAMNKDGIEPNEASLNSYRSGSRRNDRDGDVGMGFRTTIERTLKLKEQFESLLVVECTKYDQNDRRRDGEQRVRIIL